MTTPTKMSRLTGAPAAHWIDQGFIPQTTLSETIAARIGPSGSTRLVFSKPQDLSETTTTAVYEQAGRLATVLRGRGLQAGDCVAVQLPPVIEHMVTLLACIRAGFIYIPIMNTYGVAETRFILAQSKAKALFVPVRFHKTFYADHVAQLGELPDLQTVVFTGEGDVAAPALRWVDLHGDTGAFEERTSDHDEVAAIIFTSGTTADPKGVLHTDASLHAYCEVAAHYSPPRVDSFNLVALPGIGGLAYMLRPFLHGEGGIYLDQWNGGVGAELMQRYGAWWTGGSPFHLRSVIEGSPAGGLPTFEHCLVGGANVPPALIEQAETIGIHACRSYGSSEHPVGACALDEDTLEQRAYTDGRPMPGTVFRTVDDDEKDVAEGEPGEIVIQGPQMFGGYLDSTLNASAFTHDGWFKSGDIGILKDDRLTVVDRKKDMIIRGGQNISSKEVEDILCRHPAVMEAAAIGWPDPVYGERVGAFVKTVGGAPLELAEIQQHFAATGVARHKTPERLRVISEFNRNAGGKILKNQLRDLAKLEIADAEPR